VLQEGVGRLLIVTVLLHVSIFVSVRGLHSHSSGLFYFYTSLSLENLIIVLLISLYSIESGLGYLPCYLCRSLTPTFRFTQGWSRRLVAANCVRSSLTRTIARSANRRRIVEFLSPHSPIDSGLTSCISPLVGLALALGVYKFPTWL
jgi:hypothetical protein